MTYEFVQLDRDAKKRIIWGTFQNDVNKTFLFASYLLGANDISAFYVHEIETDRYCKLETFARHYSITKQDIKNH